MNDQWIVPAFTVLPITFPASTVSIASSAALFDASDVVVPLATTLSTLVDTVFDVSTSDTLSVPLVARPALVSASDAAALSPPASVITGASFVPVIVIVTVDVPLAGVPLLSVAFTVYVRISVSPAAR